MYVLDTDVFGHLQLGHSRLVAKIQATPDVEIYTTIVTKVEILRGRSDFLLKAADSKQLQRAQMLFVESEEQLSHMAILMITNATLLELEKLRGQRGLGRVGRADLLIACIALAHDATLVTRNTKDFVRIPGLKLENWVDD